MDINKRGIIKRKMHVKRNFGIFLIQNFYRSKRGDENIFHSLPNMVRDMVLKTMGSKLVNGFHRKMRIIYEVSLIHKYIESGKN